jgi:phospholipase D1/2
LWNAIRERAKKNTEVYREIFGCDPDDTARSVKELKELRNRVLLRTAKEQLAIYQQLKDEIKGYVVEWPLNFFQNEDLSLSWKQIERLVPEINFI